MKLEPKHIHILRHSLGLDEKGHGKQYRNYYCTGKDCSGYQDLLALEAAGLMALGRAEQKNIFFYVTDAGAVEAIRDVVYPKLTASQKRYRHWKNVSDAFGDMTFGEWLKTSKARKQAYNTEY